MAFMGFPDLSYIGRQRAEEAQQVGRGFGRLLGAIIGRKIQENRRAKEADRLLNALYEQYGRPGSVTSTQTDFREVPDRVTEAAPLPQVTERNLMPETTPQRAQAPAPAAPAAPGTPAAASKLEPGHAGLFSLGRGQGVDWARVAAAQQGQPAPQAAGPTQPLDILDRPDFFDRRRFTSKQNAVNLLNARNTPLTAEVGGAFPDLRAMLEPVEPRTKIEPTTTTQTVTRQGPPKELLAMIQGADLDTLQKIRETMATKGIERLFAKPDYGRFKVVNGAVVDVETGEIKQYVPQADNTLGVPELAVLAAQGDPTAIKALEFMQSFQQSRPYNQVVGFTPDAKSVVSFDTRTKQVDVTPVPGGESVTSRADRPSPGERIDMQQELAIEKNLAQLDEIVANPASHRFIGAGHGSTYELRRMLPEWMPGAASREEVIYRAAVSNFNSHTLVYLAGRAQTVHEFQRIRNLVIRDTDPPHVVQAKVAEAREIKRQQDQARQETFSRTGVVTPENPGLAHPSSSNPPSRYQDGDERIIDGVRYRRQNGVWQPVR